MRSVLRAIPLVILGLFSACSEEGAERAPETGRDALTIGLSQYPSTLHPLIDSMLAKGYVLGMANRPLAHFDHDWELECGLCTELPTLENGLAEMIVLEDGTEGMRVRWELQEDLRWADGEPVTTGDFRLAWEIGCHPEVGVAGAEAWRMVQDVALEDDRRMTLTLDRRVAGYNEAWFFHPVPEHLEREIFEADPREYRNRTLYQTEPGNPGLWMGPYRVTEVERGAYVSLARNAHWSGKAPAFDEVTVRTIERTSTLEANLLSGTIDMIAGELGLEIDQALAFRRRHGDRFQVLLHPGLFYEHLDVFLDHPALSDVRVRRALLHAVDRQGLVDDLFDGEVLVAHGFVHPLDAPYAEEGIPHYDHDPARAAALLDEAGWTLGEDGVRRNGSGDPLQFPLMSTAGNKTRELVQQVLQSQWRAVGIDVRIENENPRVFFGQTLDRRAFGGLALFGWVSAPEPTPRTILHSEAIPGEGNAWAGQNYTGFTDPEVDALIVQLEEELDPEARQEPWRRLQQIYAEQLPVLPLFFVTDAYILPPWLEGVRPTGHIIPSTVWIEDWARAE